MTRRLVRLAVIGAAGWLLGVPFATTLGAAAAKGNEAKGRYYFRQTCKTCHAKGGKGGEVTPLTKTQAQWKGFWAKAKHPGGADAWSKLGGEQFRDIETFVVNHAADSLQPETCGK